MKKIRSFSESITNGGRTSPSLLVRSAANAQLSTQYLLNRGARLTEILKQPQLSPMAIEKQVVILYAATRGHLDKPPVSKVAAFEQAVLDHLDHIDASLLKEIRETGILSPALEKRLDDCVKTLLKNL